MDIFLDILLKPPQPLMGLFLSYYEQNEMFDLYTHGTGPGLLGVVIHSLKLLSSFC